MSETAISRRFLRNKALEAPSGAPLAPQVRAEGPNFAVSTHTRVALETPLGTLVVELEEKLAPATVVNFLRYVDAGAYTGGQFHRTVKTDNQAQSPIRIGVIQGGRRASAEACPAIALERTTVTGLRHLHGTLSMARSGPETASDNFFICVGDQPELDYGGQRNPDGQGFAAFGRLVSGWLVLEQIQHAPAKEQALTPPVPIVAARRVPQ